MSNSAGTLNNSKVVEKEVDSAEDTMDNPLPSYPSKHTTGKRKGETGNGKKRQATKELVGSSSKKAKRSGGRETKTTRKGQSNIGPVEAANLRLAIQLSKQSYDEDHDSPDSEDDC